MSQRQPQLDVLVVDDSAVVRRILASVLASGNMTVTTASDPLIAMRKIRQRKPDVIVLDIEMPRMDGLTFLRNIMADAPIPVVICSGHAGRGTRTALEALSHGAVDIVTKPELGVRDFLQASASLLVDTVRTAARARLQRRPAALVRVPVRNQGGSPASERAFTGRGEKILGFGTSTGGPEALRTVLGGFPADCPATLVVQHMPAPFMEAFSERLDESSQIRVRVAEDGDRVQNGTALVAPGDRHMVLVRRGSGYAVKLTEAPPVSRHRPSVDVLFGSMARVAGSAAVGIIMTGMGADGVDGLLEMRRRGAMTIAQDAGSCVVFGMPKEAVERGAVDHVVPLPRIAPFVLDVAYRRQLSGRADASRR